MLHRYLIAFKNRKGEIDSQSVYAKSQAQALYKTKLESFEILSITKLEKKLGEKL